MSFVNHVKIVMILFEEKKDEIKRQIAMENCQKELIQEELKSKKIRKN